MGLMREYQLLLFYLYNFYYQVQHELASAMRRLINTRIHPGVQHDCIV